MVGDWRFRESGQQGKNFVTVTKVAARELPDDERMTEDVPLVQQTSKATVGAAQVVNPDRRIHERHVRQPEPAAAECS